MPQEHDSSGLWLILIPLLAATTYPISLFLVATGVVKIASQSTIRSANEIFLGYLKYGFLAACACMVICFGLLLLLAFLGGLAVAIGLMKPVSTLLSPELLALCGIIHLVGQIKAYQVAIREAVQN
jgi:hypothetical protein